MPPVLSRPISIDEEWAATLIGIRMRVPDNWLYGCTGSQLYKGRIVAVDFYDEAEQFLMLELDDDNEKGEQYHMRYNDVLHYADEGHRSYSWYYLPSNSPECPTANNNSVRVCGNIFRDDSDSDSDSDSNESDMFIRHHARRRK